VKILTAGGEYVFYEDYGNEEGPGIIYYFGLAIAPSTVAGRNDDPIPSFPYADHADGSSANGARSHESDAFPTYW